MGVVYVMLLLPQIGRRGPSPSQQRPAAALSPLLVRAITKTCHRVPLNAVLRTTIALLLLVSRPSFARASDETQIAPQSVANNLRIYNNGLATAASSTIAPSPSEIKNHQNINSINRHSSNSSENNYNGINRTRSHTASLLDPTTISLERSSSPSEASSSSAKLIFSPKRSDHLEQSAPTLRTDEYSEKLKSFGKNMENITRQLQTHAYLPCKLSPTLLKERQIGNKSVSWVRVRDDHILTVNRITFITDDRFQSYYSEANGVWTLQIKYVQARDEGIYECQVSTEPKVSAQVQLNVVVPKTELVGEPIRYVKDGSNVILRCVVREALEPPIYISWFYGTTQIYNDSPRGWKVLLERDVLDNEHDDSHRSVGSLIITSVRKRDSGNYTCSPSNSEGVTVMLHVINGEYSASAITSSSSRGRFSELIVTIIISVVMFKIT